MFVKLEFPTQKVAVVGDDCRMKVSINKAHELLGHIYEYAIRADAKALGW